MAKLISTNPAKGYEVIADVETSSESEIKQKVALAQNAKLQWKETSITKRIEIIKEVLSEFEKHSEEISLLVTKEVGKPISEGRGEVSDAFGKINYFLKNVEKSLADEITFEDNSSIHRITYEPMGVTAVITPWNYPFGMAIWGIIPNLLVGNTVVFKTSEECPLMGKLIEEIIASKNLPEGVFSTIHGAGDVGETLARSNIDLIWFTGSSHVGKLLYKIAAEKFIKVIFELGGSNPGIVFEDANIPEIVPHLLSERFDNCGQSCDALKRLIVHESIFSKLVDALKKEVENKIIGDPQNPKTQIGSLVAKRQVDLLDAQVQDAISKGAKAITGGSKPKDLSGAYYLPTLLTNITKDMRVWKEEGFAPALPIISFKTEEEAITLANDTVYGLGAKVFSSNMDRAKRVASRIQAGTVEINGVSRWTSCNNPFGGYKISGMGREHGIMGFRELCQVKVITMNK